MKYILPLVIFLIFSACFFVFQTVPSVYAQTCDLCGACNGSQPPDYADCVSCLYENAGPPPSGEKSGYEWTVVGCIPTTPGGFVQTGVRFITATVGGIMFVVLLYGSFLVLTSSGDPEKISQGKSLIASSIIALIVIVFSVFILQFIGVSLLKIPGFGEG
jgi:small-conductance mechanosensitive channel